MNSNHTRGGHPSADTTLDLFADIPSTTRKRRPPTVPLPAPRLAVPVFSIRLVRERDHMTELIRTPADAARLCCEMLQGFDREVFLAIALSTASRVIGAHVCHVGTVDASVASPREVYKFCLLVNARSVLVAHQHPSGNLEPSRADVAVSIRLKKAGEALDIPLVDSLVVGFEGRYTSLAERQLL
jgi:DNA repair protein RadC